MANSTPTRFSTALPRQPGQDTWLPHRSGRLHRCLADPGSIRKSTTAWPNLPSGAVIGVPNDPSNEGRALRVLESQGLIKLKPEAGILATAQT